jgi:AcrR family transcriptional regulator
MKETTGRPLSGRKAQAGRNDLRILASARAVFLSDPQAPVSDVAAHARVGIGAIYRRYASKDELLRQLCFHGLEQYIRIAEAALASDLDPWDAYVEFIDGIATANTHAMVLRFAGTFTPDEKLYVQAANAEKLNVRLFNRTKAAGVLRADVEVGDVALMFEQLAAIVVGDERRTNQLRKRCLALWLEALRAPGKSSLPGPPPELAELNRRWEAAMSGDKARSSTPAPATRVGPKKRRKMR